MMSLTVSPTSVRIFGKTSSMPLLSESIADVPSPIQSVVVMMVKIASTSAGMITPAAWSKAPPSDVIISPALASSSDVPEDPLPNPSANALIASAAWVAMSGILSTSPCTRLPMSSAPAFKKSGILPMMSVTTRPMPFLMSSKPLVSPANILAMPFTTSVAAGRNSADTRFLKPVMAPWSVVCASQKSAAALTESSDMTMPYRSAISICSLIASVPPLISGASSDAPLPRSLDASAVRSAPSSIPESASIVAPNSSSCDMLATSSWLSPSSWNASLFLTASVDSFFITGAIESMDVPALWRT